MHLPDRRGHVECPLQVHSRCKVAEEDLDCLQPTAKLEIQFRRSHPQLKIRVLPLQDTLLFWEQLKLPCAFDLLDAASVDCTHSDVHKWKFICKAWISECCARLGLNVAVPIQSR